MPGKLRNQFMSELAVVVSGSIEIEADVNGECSTLDVSNVLCVPDLAVNFLSVCRICKKGYNVTFTSRSWVVTHETTGTIIASAIARRMVYTNLTNSDNLVLA